jgi:hypothetical protein
MSGLVCTVSKVLGYLPGQTGEYEIIGAHYDHLIWVNRIRFAGLVEGAGRHAGLTNDLSETGGYGASDHTFL